MIIPYPAQESSSGMGMTVSHNCKVAQVGTGARNSA